MLRGEWPHRTLELDGSGVQRLVEPWAVHRAVTGVRALLRGCQAEVRPLKI